MDPRASLSTAPTTIAAVWRGGTTVALEPVPLPSPGPGELLVAVDLATVCGSDRHTVAGRRAAPCPSVLGHEAVGHVVAAGVGASAAVGDRVVWGVTVGCGRCDRCTGGRTAKCRRLRKVGHEPFDGAWQLSGSYAAHVLLPAGATVVPVPAALPDVLAAPAACATATVMAALEAAGPLAGARVLVCGAGMLGLTATAAAADRGAAAVLVTDVAPARLDLAGDFGATRTLRSDQTPPAVDVALEFSGATSAATTALGALDIGGRLVLAGAVTPVDTLPVDPEAIVRGWLTVTGVHNYEPRHLRQAVDYLTASREAWPWERLVAPAVPLDRVGALLTRPPQHEPRAAIAP
ncbi:alcohol dehydrogenase catalytic domain-containing protein [Jiangella alba]|uniref:alcohol dehydrogenase n=1 Tax=Jiangella alba TaxID=561176 RepID=A0A1H5JD43_9ACTN|nr:alcohol dehydrogenase catalytic domain-containing protein [Jiangella alba]SEE49961.1 putative phosphonate catabolism associated alcohol dehydrogenase [Jiangella alba]